jgi:predicted DNA-binding transcriptional regulator AlpA
MSETGRMLDTAEAAAYTGLAPGTLRNMVSQGRGPNSYRLTTRRKYRLADLDAWIASCASDAPVRRRRRGGSRLTPAAPRHPHASALGAAG